MKDFMKKSLDEGFNQESVAIALCLKYDNIVNPNWSFQDQYSETIKPMIEDVELVFDCEWETIVYGFRLWAVSFVYESELVLFDNPCNIKDLLTDENIQWVDKHLKRFENERNGICLKETISPEVKELTEVLRDAPNNIESLADYLIKVGYSR